MSAKYQIQFGAFEAVALLNAVELKYHGLTCKFLAFRDPESFPETTRWLLEQMDEQLKLWWKIENAEIV